MILPSFVLFFSGRGAGRRLNMARLRAEKSDGSEALEDLRSGASSRPKGALYLLT